MREMADLDIPSISLKPTALGLKDGVFESHSWISDEIRFVDAKINSMLTCFRGKRHTQDIGHLVFITRYFGGSAKGYLGDQIIDRHPGSIYIMDGEMHWNGIQECGSVQTINLPKSVLSYDPDTHPSFVEINPASALGECLDATLDAAFDALIAAPSEFAPSTLNELVACVKLSLGHSPQHGDIRTHTRAALHRVICKFIERNLHDPELSTERILQNFGVSRASLYRMFEHQEGVRRYITDRRALHAVVDLSNSTGRRGYVREVSDRWGFPSPIEFNRTIRRLYDDSPGRLFQPQLLDA